MIGVLAGLAFVGGVAFLMMRGRKKPKKPKPNQPTEEVTWHKCWKDEGQMGFYIDFGVENNASNN